LDTLDATDTLCVCQHSAGVHNVKGRAGCIFCSCQEFQAPVFTMTRSDVKLSSYSSSALDVLRLPASGLRTIEPDALVEFVKDGKGRMYSSDTRILTRGEKSQTLHVVLSGSLFVEKEKANSGREVGPGEVAGDLRAFTGDPRWASITTLGSASTLEIDTTNLGSAFGQYPDLFKTLVKSLMPTSERPEEIMKSPLWAARRQPAQAAATAAAAGDDPEAAKKAAILARWELMKRERLLAEEAARRAQRVARDAIKTQTKR
jgi:CRP-like cAMP-binding protein